MGCFPGDFREGKRPIKAFGKRPIKVGKRPIKEGKRPIKLNGLFSETPLWRKTAPLKRPVKGIRENVGILTFCFWLIWGFVTLGRGSDAVLERIANAQGLFEGTGALGIRRGCLRHAIS